MAETKAEMETSEVFNKYRIIDAKTGEEKRGKYFCLRIDAADRNERNAVFNALFEYACSQSMYGDPEYAKNVLAFINDEATWKLEKSAVEADAPVGNSAAMRDALVSVYVILEKLRPFVTHLDHRDGVQHMRDFSGLVCKAKNIIDVTLATPTRNCDRFKNAYDAMKAWQLEFKTIKEDMTLAQMFARMVKWLLAPAEEGCAE